MANLAEPRRKQKWSLDPRGTAWANDDNKVGQKLMEKMGWTKGKGLGREEQGMTEHLTVRQKNSNKGVGYQGKDDDEWINHYEGFENVLASLNSEENSVANSNINSTSNSVVNSDDEGGPRRDGGKSLEAMSKTSRARVHYHKFTRGKDVSRYNADDMGCILGSKRAKIKAKAHKEEEEKEGYVADMSGVTTIKGGTIQDYFAKRMEAMKNKSEIQMSEDNICEDSSQAKPSFGMDSSCYDERDTVEAPCFDRAAYKSKKKNKKKRQLDVDGGMVTIESKEGQVNGNERNENGRDTVEVLNKETVIRNEVHKKKRKYMEIKVETNTIDLPGYSSGEEHSKVKKKKKSKNSQKIELTEEIFVSAEGNPEPKRKKNKKEMEALLEDTCSEIENTSVEKKKKRRKKNKEQDHENVYRPIHVCVDNQCMDGIKETESTGQINGNESNGKLRVSVKKICQENMIENGVHKKSRRKYVEIKDLANNAELPGCSSGENFKAKKIKKKKKKNSVEKMLTQEVLVDAEGNSELKKNKNKKEMEALVEDNCSEIKTTSVERKKKKKKNRQHTEP